MLFTSYCFVIMCCFYLHQLALWVLVFIGNRMFCLLAYRCPAKIYSIFIITISSYSPAKLKPICHLCLYFCCLTPSRGDTSQLTCYLNKDKSVKNCCVSIAPCGLSLAPCIIPQGHVLCLKLFLLSILRVKITIFKLEGTQFLAA